MTHHAEDGSGVGSAIIAGESTLFRDIPAARYDLSLAAMTKIRKDAGLYLHV